MSNIGSITIARIEVSDDRARGLDTAWVEGLASIIEAEGLIQPIAVKRIGEHINGDPLYKLMAGGHRLAACKALGWGTIPAVVYEAGFGGADLIETLENLARRELTPLDRAKHFARFKAAYEAKHGPIQPGPKTTNSPRNGLIAGEADNQRAQDGFWSFHEVIAERTGFKRSSIFEYLAIWNGLATGSYERIAAQDKVARNKGQLKKLSEQNHDRQDQALGLIETGKASGVDEALDQIDEVFRQSPAEKRLTVARGAWSRLTQSQKRAFLADNEHEVRQFAIERGWIA
jgi:ParB family chromosome partitioning protein